MISKEKNTEPEKDLKDIGYLQAFFKIAGSLYAIMAMAAFGYFYFLSKYQFQEGNFLLKFATNFLIMFITFLLLLQMFYFSDEEMKKIRGKTMRIIFVSILSLVLAISFIISVINVVNMISYSASPQAVLVLALSQ